MPEEDWYGPFRGGRWKGYVFILGGATFVVLALAGFTFERQVVVDGIRSPFTRWGQQIQWPPLVGGLLAIAFGVHLARRGISDVIHEPDRMKHESLAGLSEAELVRRLVDDVQWRSTVFGLKGLDSSSDIRLCVPIDTLPNEPRGDIDILLVPPGQPARATAIEVKRIKVRDGLANKLQEFEKGVRQANNLKRLGFSQVYLYILVAIDSRLTNAGTNSYADGMSPELRGQIHQLISPSLLLEGVGLMHQEFVQPMDHEPLGIGSYGGHLVRLAVPSEQPSEVTDWVRALIASSAA